MIQDLDINPELISIMMPAYNAEKFIGQAIDSILSQRYSNWELIIVDDGSSDGTADVIANYDDPRILALNQPNQGEAAARNSALGNTSGSYLTFLDADDVFLTNHLELLVNYLERHPGHDGVYTDGYYINQNDQQLETLSSRRRGPYEGDIFEQLVRASDVFGPPICVGLRCSRIRERNLRFDEKITIGPDWDFMTRYSEWTQFGYIDQVTCLYRIHQTNVTVRAGREKRAVDLALCRQKAIKLERFHNCSEETKAAVFYDLLIELLQDRPEKQMEIVKWPEFLILTSDIQARLLRLMASNAIAKGASDGYIGVWIHEARQLNPGDKRGILLDFLFKASPGLCRRFLKVKNRSKKTVNQSSPFESLALGQTS